MTRRAQQAIVVTTVALVLWGAAVAVRAYVLAGYSWGNRSVTFYVNPNSINVTPAGAIADIQSAAANWNTQGGSNINLVYGGTTTTNVVALDYTNNVFFRTDSAGYIGATYCWATTAGQLLDCDTVLNDMYKLYAGNVGCNGDGYYVENTSTHEFGHFLGLAHTPVTTATMYATEGLCETSKEVLSSDDISGLQAIYGAKAVVAAPAAPSGLSVAGNTASPFSSLNLAWLDNANNASGYDVQRSTDNVTFNQVAQVASNATAFTDTGLAAGTTYYYRVYAYNNGGSSQYSNVASNQTQAAPTVAAGAPTNPNPGNAATGVNANPTLSWSAAGATSYTVSLYVGSSLTPTITKSNLTSPSVGIGSLASGTTYSWQVTAVNSVGSTAGPRWVFTTKATAGKKK